MIEELLERVESTYDKAHRKFYGVTTGRVMSPPDLLMLGRVQVQLPFIDSLDVSPWARVAVPMTGAFAGTYFIPSVGDEVLVAFEHGDVNAPYIIGCLWNMVARPPVPTSVPPIRAIRTIAGTQLVITEAPPAIALQTAPTPPVTLPAPPSPTGPHQTVMLTPAGIQIMGTTITLQSGTSSVLISPAGITLQAGPNTITMTPAGVDILAAEVTVTGIGGVSVNGAPVRINS